MKSDGYLPNDLGAVGQHAARLESEGLVGAFTAETSHDPFLPLGLGRLALPAFVVTGDNDDEMLSTIAVIAEPDDVQPALETRYGQLVDRFSRYSVAP